MRTCLGAAAALDPAAVTPDMFAGARLVMLEGYTLFNHDLSGQLLLQRKKPSVSLRLTWRALKW